jgi:hypothetical protein
MRFFRFKEPHITGGVAIIEISEYQIISHMKSIYPNRHPGMLDQELVEDFIALHWAEEIKAEQMTTSGNSSLM